MLNMTVRWLKHVSPHELEFEGISEEVLRTHTGASSTTGVPKRYHSPKDLVAIGIAGCTGVDVVSILKKMRQPLEDLAIDIGLTQTTEHPRVFNTCALSYRFIGQDLDADRVVRAAALSFGKYCGVSAMIKRSGCHFEPMVFLNGQDLTQSFNVVLEELERADAAEGSPQRNSAALLITGNEILLGKTQDTNGRFLARELGQLGWDVDTIRFVGDNRQQLIAQIKELAGDHSLVIMTGGLGPTSDDLTSEVVAEAFSLPLQFSPDAWDICVSAFKKMGRDEIPESNRKQAILPAGSSIIQNSFGTAAGFSVTSSLSEVPCTLIALPGVPWECEEMFKRELSNKLKKNQSQTIEYGPWHIWGIGESALQTQLSEIEASLREKCPEIVFSYQAHAGYISYGLKVIQNCEDKSNQREENSILQEIDRIENVFNSRLLFKGRESLLSRLKDVLSFEPLTVALGESCTGGKIAAELTSIEGISPVFMGGVVTYSNEAKMNILGVSGNTLSTFGAVSSETAVEMAVGVAREFKSSIALSVTGIAGPGGGSAEKPVGTVCFSLALRLNDSQQEASSNLRNELDKRLSLQGWKFSSAENENGMLILYVEKKFGQHFSRELVQRRASIFALCSLLMTAESFRGLS